MRYNTFEGRIVLAMLTAIFQRNPKTSFADAAKEMEGLHGLPFDEVKVRRLVKLHDIPKAYPKHRDARTVLPCQMNPEMSHNHKWERKMAWEDTWVIRRFQCAYCRCWGWDNRKREEPIRPYPPKEQEFLPKEHWYRVDNKKGKPAKPEYTLIFP